MVDAVKNFGSFLVAMSWKKWLFCQRKLPDELENFIGT